MAIVYRCDICRNELGSDVTEMSVNPGAMQMSVDRGARFSGAGRPAQYLLCGSCSRVLHHHIDARRVANGVAR